MFKDQQVTEIFLYVAPRMRPINATEVEEGTTLIAHKVNEQVISTGPHKQPGSWEQEKSRRILKWQEEQPKESYSKDDNEKDTDTVDDQPNILEPPEVTSARESIATLVMEQKKLRKQKLSHPKSHSLHPLPLEKTSDHRIPISGNPVPSMRHLSKVVPPRPKVRLPLNQTTDAGEPLPHTMPAASRQATYGPYQPQGKDGCFRPK